MYGTDAAPATETSLWGSRPCLPRHALSCLTPSVMRPLGVGEVFDVVFVANAREWRWSATRIFRLYLANLGHDSVLLVGPGWEGLGYPRQSVAVAWGPLLNVLYNLGRVCVRMSTIWNSGLVRTCAWTQTIGCSISRWPNVLRSALRRPQRRSSSLGTRFRGGGYTSGVRA